MAFSRTGCLALAGLLLAAGPASAQDLPTADELIAKAIDAVGGPEAFESVETLSFHAELSMEGEEGAATFEGITAPDGSFLIEGVDMSSGEDFVGGWDGDVGWAREADEDWTLQDREDTLFIQMIVANQFMLLRLEEWFEGRETIERATFHGHDAYRVRFVDEDEDVLEGGEDLFGWFDAKSGMLLAMADEENEGMRFFEYEAVGPIKVSRRVELSLFGDITIQFSDLEVNEADASRLEMPDPVRELVRAREDRGFHKDD